MSYQTSIALVKYSLRLARTGPNIEARFCHAILGGHMNEIFRTDFSVIGEVFHSLVEFDKKYTTDSNLQRLLAVIFTIFEVRVFVRLPQLSICSRRLAPVTSQS